jgi:hypothetical protein
VVLQKSSQEELRPEQEALAMRSPPRLAPLVFSHVANLGRHSGPGQKADVFQQALAVDRARMRAALAGLAQREELLRGLRKLAAGGSQAAAE